MYYQAGHADHQKERNVTSQAKTLTKTSREALSYFYSTTPNQMVFH